MNVIKFNGHRTQIVYGIVDRTAYCQDMWAREVVKNIGDYTIQDLTATGYTVLVSTNEEQIMQAAAASDAEYIVMIASGTEFVFDPINGNRSNLRSTGDTFVECVDHFCNNTDFFIAGHVLDRKDSYYELHHQCFVVNLKLYRALNCPAIGQPAYYDKHSKVMPNRSQDNKHDDYTPTTISPGTQVTEYSHKCHGWHIIAVALDNSLPVIVFDENLRITKRHYYPEHPQAFNRAINFAYNRQEFCATWAVSPFNSDGYTTHQICDTIEQLVVPASGLNWLLYLAQNGYNERTVVKFYDYSMPALDYMRQLIEWDGNDYPTFVNEYVQDNFGFLNNSDEILICGPKDLQGAWDKFQQRCDWHTLWDHVRNTVRFEFHAVNLLDSSKSLNWIDPTPATLFNMTNIFNYIGTATTYSVATRVYAENELLRKLKARCPSALLIMSRQAASGFHDNLPSFPIRAADMPFTDIEQLTKPSWHFNNDWVVTPT